MPETGDPHAPVLEQIKDGPWTVGYRISCACGWHTSDHIRPGQATRDHYTHRLDQRTTVKETTT